MMEVTRIAEVIMLAIEDLISESVIGAIALSSGHHPFYEPLAYIVHIINYHDCL